MPTDKKIDPRFFIPPVDGLETKDNSFGYIPEDEPQKIIIRNEATGLRAPDSFSVVDAIYRKGADGKTVVDLVVEVEELMAQMNMRLGRQ